NNRTNHAQHPNQKPKPCHEKIFFKKIRWIIPLLIYSAYGLIEALFIESGLFQELQKLWSISLTAEFKFHYEHSGWTVTFSQVDLPGILLVYYTVLGVCLFYLSCKLLNRRVEV
ncbi:hypothetical protein, partial [Bacillus paralicheniformis]|uniref:hypothetical protein n=1 Tax=Bacillus paralicheniformis TaxID=1648923 RepID=UPI00119F3F93